MLRVVGRSVRAEFARPTGLPPAVVVRAACRPQSTAPMAPEVMQRLTAWTQAMVAAPPRKVHSVIDTGHANLYGATMALSEKEPWRKFVDGSPLPPLWHLAYFVEVRRAGLRSVVFPRGRPPPSTETAF